MSGLELIMWPHATDGAHRHTNKHTDMETLWLNQPSRANSVKKKQTVKITKETDSNKKKQTEMDINRQTKDDNHMDIAIYRLNCARARFSENSHFSRKIQVQGTLNHFFFYVEISFWKVTQFSDFFWKLFSC